MPTSRRDVFAGSAALFILTAQSAGAKSKKITTEDHTAHMHMSEAPEFVLTAAEEEVVKALTMCSAAGEACLSQCLQTLAAGDVSMSACANAVREMLAICEASKTLVQSHSSFAGRQLALCQDACRSCKSECEPHKDHHATCRSCAEACEAAIAAIDQILAG